MNELPANWEPPEKRRTEEEERRRESFKPIFVTIGVAFVLLLGSLMGWLSTCGSVTQRADPSNDFWGVLLTLSIAAFLMAMAWLVISLVLKIVKSVGSR